MTDNLLQFCPQNFEPNRLYFFLLGYTLNLDQTVLYCSTDQALAIFRPLVIHAQLGTLISFGSIIYIYIYMSHNCIFTERQLIPLIYSYRIFHEQGKVKNYLSIWHVNR